MLRGGSVQEYAVWKVLLDEAVYLREINSCPLPRIETVNLYQNYPLEDK
jgi:hypothetical protein